MNRAHNPVNIAFIGCGGVADLHAVAIQLCESAKLIAVYDKNEQLAAGKAAQWGAEVRSFAEICQADDIDAIYVLTPMESHIDYAEQALRSGKHVLVEKPVSEDLDGIERLINLQEKTGKVCMPGHSYLYLPEIRRMQRLVRRGQIGTPTAMFMSEIYKMPDELVQKYHGPSTEVLCHQIYLMQALLGEPEQLQAFSGSFRKELFPDDDEHVQVNVRFKNGALAHLYVSWANHDETSDPWTFKMKLWGTEGGMHFSRRDQVYGTSEEMREYPLYLEMFEQETVFFIERCIMHGEPPLSTIRDAKRTMLMAAAIRRSFKNGTTERLQYD